MVSNTNWDESYVGEISGVTVKEFRIVTENSVKPEGGFGDTVMIFMA